jgi:hypothetical protein
MHIFRPIESPDSASLIEGLRAVLDHRVAHDSLRRANSTNYLKLKIATEPLHGRSFRRVLELTQDSNRLDAPPPLAEEGNARGGVMART